VSVGIFQPQAVALFIIGTSIGTLRVISDNDKLVHYRDLQDNGMCANHSVVAVGRFIRTMHIRIHSGISPVLVVVAYMSAQRLYVRIYS
jgi:hypothetical protein